SSGAVWVDAYTDFKLNDICDAADRKPQDMNQPQWSDTLRQGNCRFLTKRLWGAANEKPYFHHGLFTTLRQAILAHSGEAKSSRVAFQALPSAARDAVVDLLTTMQFIQQVKKGLVVY